MSPAPDADFIERLRASGISVDREGVFWHEGERVQHEGLRQALWRWLDRLPPPDSRHILRLDERRVAYLDVADTPLVVTSLRWQGDTALLGLNDGSEEALAPETLTIDDAGVLRAAVRGGRLEARLATAAAAVLAERIDDGGRLRLPAGPGVIRSRATRR